MELERIILSKVTHSGGGQLIFSYVEPNKYTYMYVNKCIYTYSTTHRNENKEDQMQMVDMSYDIKLSGFLVLTLSSAFQFGWWISA